MDKPQQTNPTAIINSLKVRVFDLQEELSMTHAALQRIAQTVGLDISDGLNVDNLLQAVEDLTTPEIGEVQLKKAN